MNFTKPAIFLLILSLIITAYQDLKQRSIHVALPVAIFICAIALNFFKIEINYIDAIINILFISINLIGLTIYFSIKSRKPVNPVDSSIGMGDIAFFIAITPLFKLKPFIVFFITGLIVSLILHLVGNLFKDIKTIPLAGYLSVYLIGYIVIRDFYKLIPFY